MAKMIYKPKGFLLNGSVLEYEAIGTVAPADFTNAGVILSIAKAKWILPFKETFIMVNLRPVMPDKTIGLITSLGYTKLDVTTRVISDTHTTPIFIKVRNKSLLPKKIKEGVPLALLTVLPYVELQFIENNNIDET